VHRGGSGRKKKRGKKDGGGGRQEVKVKKLLRGKNELQKKRTVTEGGGNFRSRGGENLRLSKTRGNSAQGGVITEITMVIEDKDNGVGDRRKLFNGKN